MTYGLIYHGGLSDHFVLRHLDPPVVIRNGRKGGIIGVASPSHEPHHILSRDGVPPPLTAVQCDGTWSSDGTYSVRPSHGRVLTFNEVPGGKRM